VFLVTFVPYFLARFFGIYFAYDGVDTHQIWVAQQAWFSYAVCSLSGIIDAIQEAITGKAMKGWTATGEGKRVSSIELVNVFILLVLVIAIVVQFVKYVINPGDLNIVAAIFFSGTIVIQMWPMVSATIYERIYNMHLRPEERLDLQRLEFPNYVIYFFAVILSFIVSYVFVPPNLDSSSSGTPIVKI